MSHALKSTENNQMKTIAITLSLDELPFKLHLTNISAAIDERMKTNGPAGYISKVMACTEDGFPLAILFAYSDDSEPNVKVAIETLKGIVGQAAVAFGGWTLWDLLRNQFGVFEFLREDDDDFYSQLVDSLKLNNEPKLKPISSQEEPISAESRDSKKYILNSVDEDVKINNFLEFASPKYINNIKR